MDRALFTAVVFALLVTGLIAFCFWWDAKDEENCRAKGGQYVHVYKGAICGAICVKPGTVIE